MYSYEHASQIAFYTLTHSVHNFFSIQVLLFRRLQQQPMSFMKSQSTNSEAASQQFDLGLDHFSACVMLLNINVLDIKKHHTCSR